MIEARERAPRAARGRCCGVAPEQVALTGSTTDGCNIVLAGLGLGPDDEIVTTDVEHFGLLGPLHASGARIARRPVRERPAERGARRDPGRGHAAHAAARALARRLVDRERPAGRRAEGADRAADPRRRRAVGRRDPRRRDPRSTTTRSPARSGSAGRTGTGALVVADPERLRLASPTSSRGSSHDADGSLRAEARRGAIRHGWLEPGQIAGPRGGARRRAGVALRAGARAGPPRARAARGGGRGRHGPGPGDARHVPRSTGDTAEAVERARRAGRRDPRPPRHRLAAGLGRLVDERRGRRAPRRALLLVVGAYFSRGRESRAVVDLAGPVGPRVSSG